jgi:hypothetical protein
MALVVVDRVQETTATTGTGTYNLAGAKSGFASFSGVGDGNTTYYACSDGTDFEVGLGTYTASGSTLARTTILSSSNSNNAVNWGAGDKDIFVTLPSAKSVLEDASNNVTTGGTVNGRNLSTDGTKLDGIEASATADQTDAEIKTAYENNSDTNAFTDALQTKLNGVAASANAYVHPNHSGEVTSTADGATVVADNIIDEANLKVSNTPTDGYFLSAQSGNTGGLTWASPPSGYADSDVDAHLLTSGITTNAISGLSTNTAPFEVNTSGTSGTIAQFHNSTGKGIDISTASNGFQCIIQTTYGSDLLFKYGSGYERFRLRSNGAISLGGGGNEGSSGQVLMSNGSNSAAYWGSVSSGYSYGSSPTFYQVNIQNGGYIYSYGDITTTNTLYCQQINVAGTTYYGGGYYLSYSDDILKQRIANIPEALSKISQLNGFHYTDSDTVTDLIRGTNPDGTINLIEKETAQKVGVSAQELEKVLPEAVGKTLSKQSTTETEYLTVDYAKIVPLLVEGIKELKTKVETLETENTAIKARLDALEA